jgi:hypothetical protein
MKQEPTNTKDKLNVWNSSDTSDNCQLWQLWTEVVFLFVIFAASGIAMTFIGSFFYLYTLSPYPSSPMKKMI